MAVSARSENLWPNAFSAFARSARVDHGSGRPASPPAAGAISRRHASRSRVPRLPATASPRSGIGAASRMPMPPRSTIICCPSRLRSRRTSSSWSSAICSSSLPAAAPGGLPSSMRKGSAVPAGLLSGSGRLEVMPCRLLSTTSVGGLPAHRDIGAPRRAAGKVVEPRRIRHPPQVGNTRVAGQAEHDLAVGLGLCRDLHRRAEDLRPGVAYGQRALGEFDLAARLGKWRQSAGGDQFVAGELVAAVHPRYRRRDRAACRCPDGACRCRSPACRRSHDRAARSPDWR